MNFPTLVTPYNKELIFSFQNHDFIIRTDNPRKIEEIEKFVNKDNNLVCIILETTLPVSDLPLKKNLSGLNIIIYATMLGDFKKFAGRIPFIKKLNPIIFLKSDKEENYTSLQILSSLKISSGLLFTEKVADWDLVSDLLYYFIYARIPHGKIEPFNYIVSNYLPNTPTDFRTVYFDNPQYFIHLNEKGKVALTHKHLLTEKFLDIGLDNISSVHEAIEYEKYKENWRNTFLEMNPCACCPAWRICLGKFYHAAEDHENQCSKVMSELLEATEITKEKIPENNYLWQL